MRRLRRCATHISFRTCRIYPISRHFRADNRISMIWPIWSECAQTTWCTSKYPSRRATRRYRNQWSLSCCRGCPASTGSPSQLDHVLSASSRRDGRGEDDGCTNRFEMGAIRSSCRYDRALFAECQVVDTVRAVANVNAGRFQHRHSVLISNQRCDPVHTRRPPSARCFACIFRRAPGRVQFRRTRDGAYCECGMKR